MRWIAIAALVGLTACGMSDEEKTNIAAATCSLLSEYSESDGVARMKEINWAREKLQQPLFLGSGVDIQDALEYGLCIDLVLNDLEYNVRLAEAEQSRVEKFQQFLSGAWFYAHETEGLDDGFFVVAEFLGEDLILSNYSINEDYEQEKRELNFRTKVLSDSQIIASGSDKDDFILHVDWDNGTIRLGAFDCPGGGTCNFIKAPKVSLEDINGKWLGSTGDGDLWLSEYSEDSARYYGRYFDHENKTFENSFSECGFRLDSGFVFVDLCSEAEPYYYPITKVSPSELEQFSMDSGHSWEEVRVRSEYEFPEPPNGYREAATK